MLIQLWVSCQIPSKLLSLLLYILNALNVLYTREKWLSSLRRKNKKERKRIIRFDSPTHGLPHNIRLQSLQIINSADWSGSPEHEHAWNANDVMNANVAFLQLDKSSAETRQLPVIGSTEQRLKYDSNSTLRSISRSKKLNLTSWSLSHS